MDFSFFFLYLFDQIKIGLTSWRYDMNKISLHFIATINVIVQWTMRMWFYWFCGYHYKAGYIRTDCIIVGYRCLNRKSLLLIILWFKKKWLTVTVVHFHRDINSDCFARSRLPLFLPIGHLWLWYFCAWESEDLVWKSSLFVPIDEQRLEIWKRTIKLNGSNLTSWATYSNEDWVWVFEGQTSTIGKIGWTKT